MKRLRQYFFPPLPALLALGFSSGLPLALTASSLSIWLKEEGISKTSIGLFGGISIAYACKFAWSPLVDNLRLPVLTTLLGRRRAWLLASQAALALCIAALSCMHPAAAPLSTAFIALLVAIASATQDIAIDAYRVEMLTPERQALGSAVAVLGYRLGMIASSAGALLLATAFGWQATYLCMALLVGVGTAAMLIAGEPPRPEGSGEGKSWLGWFRQPLFDMMQRQGWLVILAFVLFYKLPDAFLGLMANPYYLEAGYTKVQIAEVAKVYGLLATICGGFLGAWLAKKLGLHATLWIGGIACALGTLLFIPLQHAGASTAWLALVIGLDNISGGISTTALVAYISGLCNTRFTATQYALLSSLAASARTLSTLPSGWSADTFGWTGFFIICALLALPGLLLLSVLTKRKAY